MKDYIFTSESVSEGHPDKICDRISDTILDLYLSRDSQSRVAAECMAFTDHIVIAGEIRSSSDIPPHDTESAVRDAVRDIGYGQDGFHADTVTIDIRLTAQSPDIAMGVDAKDDKGEGAGDQGIMFGYACNETDTFMPAAICYSHKILENLSLLRKSDASPRLGPDAKSQVTIAYQDGRPAYAHSVVLSTQHAEKVTQDDVRAIVLPVIRNSLPNGWITDETRFFINPTGRFVVGGPVGDCGLTGRKIIVDTYGGAAPHGGGAFSGKDPTKVDRSAAYAARYLAKNIVAAGYAEKCTIQLSYSIGVPDPVAIYVNTHGTGRICESLLSKAVSKAMDLTPRGIIRHLGLDRPIYTPTAAYGHFGRTPTDEGHFSWERLDLRDKLDNSLS